MGYALFITFNPHVSGVDGWDICGKTLAHHLEKLDDVARQLQLLPLGEMISVSEEYLEDLIDEDIKGCQEQWLLPSVGLLTVNGLMSFIQENSNHFHAASQLLEDLSHLRHCLNHADQQSTLFHLTPDF
ncbi:MULTISPECIES: hypothetical protein [unclassified Leptolyngbya]|uniref:hypothetical protein n=1 Tax=unclassified Leptolyngbya TaxID=2650499 RepID=UPI00168992DB|nr:MULTISPECIES: hypothetical protein [unclassified Leptolyngbya]MBD1913751.1 hypothetical protein [Leptolyngbya sp. FACHB-8]MBD2153213.1 hypothetical protein [Leptolyngbya sp. FACHB-16]